MSPREIPNRPHALHRRSDPPARSPRRSIAWRAALRGLLCVVALILAQPVSAQLSDDFNQCTLDTGLWTAVDPVGDATFEVVGGGSGAASASRFRQARSTFRIWRTTPRV